MRNFTWSFLMFFCFVFTSFSQTKTLEKGTYLSTNKGQKIKLNLLENNKYELVFYSGDYQIKGDSVSFTSIDKPESGFDLVFKNDKKAKKVKIKFINPSYYSFFIGSQNGSNEIKYQRLSDIWSQENVESANPDAEFEIDRADYLYLVFEDYKGESKVSKFALPKEVSEVTINYQPDLFGNLNISGFFNKNTNELMVSEKSGKDPLVFVNQKNAQPEKTSKVVPLEIKSIVNWTYPGKDIAESEEYAVVVDSAATAADSVYVPEIYDFKFKIQDNLKSALAATAADKTKFLVVAVDTKNPSAKKDFDTFIEKQESLLGVHMATAYSAENDSFNFYLANANDKKWLKSVKITDDKSLIVLNENGDVLASAKSTLLEKEALFDIYSDFARQLKIADTYYSLGKVVKNKKASDEDLIAAFRKSVLSYDFGNYYTIYDQTNQEDFKFANTKVDLKEVTPVWKKLIETHQKDTKPNMYLVETILKEIKNQGFSKQVSKEDKVLNDTDFLSIDYLIKHYDAIDAERLVYNEKEGEKHNMGSLNQEIAGALQQNKNIVSNEASVAGNQDKTISVYKKLIAAGKGNFETYQNYLAYLAETADNDGSNGAYLKEFNAYFTTNLGDKGNVIERLDQMFGALGTDSEYGFNGWNWFKEYHSNLCNSAAWTVVSRPGNTDFLKSAIGWSEYSLAVTKNNPYYLDTLAQLYYKDGQKNKAIETQILAAKYLNSEVEEQTAVEIRETLTKMQNGTY
ncbi:CDC27 family protein [Flavobacterium sp. UGB4466]|uniref:CDC27 family protein n=1 Tax=Flavobacterium sp. UGB4466 TaxID=2730889 RepID=UPI001ED8C797|nr:CDC27 family protein [Flavobacterium sp. UGB4466]